MATCFRHILEMPLPPLCARLLTATWTSTNFLVVYKARALVVLAPWLRARRAAPVLLWSQRSQNWLHSFIFSIWRSEFLCGIKSWAPAFSDAWLLQETLQLNLPQSESSLLLLLTPEKCFWHCRNEAKSSLFGTLLQHLWSSFCLLWICFWPSVGPSGMVKTK